MNIYRHPVQVINILAHTHTHNDTHMSTHKHTQKYTHVLCCCFCVFLMLPVSINFCISNLSRWSVQTIQTSRGRGSRVGASQGIGSYMWHKHHWTSLKKIAGTKSQECCANMMCQSGIDPWLLGFSFITRCPVPI